MEAACNRDRGIVLSFSCAVANRQGTEKPFLLRKIVGMSRQNRLSEMRVALQFSYRISSCGPYAMRCAIPCQ